MSSDDIESGNCQNQDRGSKSYCVNVVKNNNYHDITVYNRKQTWKQAVLLDSGADKAYIDARLVNKWGLVVRTKRNPYTPKNAQDQNMDEVNLEVDITFGFGDHIETFTFDVLHIPTVDMILGDD